MRSFYARSCRHAVDISGLCREIVVVTRGKVASPSASSGFPPIAGPGARVLVLGTLPSQASLDAGQYYAHPQNAFWKIMAELADASGDYDARTTALVAAGIAVWDVLASSIRPGSMDADIDMTSAMPNDFQAFFSQHESLELVCFNGQKSEQLFKRFVEPTMKDTKVRTARLPSTSPAYASMSFEQKLAAWRGIIEPAIERG